MKPLVCPAASSACRGLLPNWYNLDVVLANDFPRA